MSSPKKKKKQAIAPVSANNAVLRAVEEAKKRQDAVRSLFGDEIIAPVGQQVSATPTSTQTQDNELLSVFNKWLESQKNNISNAGEAIANTFSPVAKAFGQNDTEAWYRDYIDPKRFDDGYDFGDVTMSILGTGVDATADFAAGTGEMVEGGHKKQLEAHTYEIGTDYYYCIMTCTFDDSRYTSDFSET